MTFIKSIIIFTIDQIIFFLSKILKRNKFWLLFIELLNKNVYRHTTKIKCNKTQLIFFIPNRLINYRIKTFFSKEPQTLKWIDRFKKNSVFWDIGSNIGLFTCYAAKKKNCKVISFEPSVFNLEILCRNIFINKIIKNVSVFSLPLSDKIKESFFNMSNTEFGGAISTFGENYTYDGSKLDMVFRYKTFSMNIDKFVKVFKVPYPKYIKIDVDGIEHLILKKGLKVLKKAKEILIEVDEKFKKQNMEIELILKKLGYKLFSKDILNKNKQIRIFNQLWVKD